MKTEKEIMEALSAPIPASRVMLRVGMHSAKTGVVTLLTYKDARVDAERLDRVLGCFGWQRVHQGIGDVNYCGVGIQNPETGEWVYKWDAGTESKTEAEKGEASDAFKRACFQWGIGRELYSMPNIMFNLTKFGLEKFYASDFILNVAHFKDGEYKNKPCYVKVTHKKSGKDVFTWKHEKFDKDNIIIYNEL